MRNLIFFFVLLVSSASFAQFDVMAVAEYGNYSSFQQVDLSNFAHISGQMTHEQRDQLKQGFSVIVPEFLSEDRCELIEFSLNQEQILMALAGETPVIEDNYARCYVRRIPPVVEPPQFIDSSPYDEVDQ